MTPREMIAHPLLLKELASQARRPGRPGWTYPGPRWFLVATLVPALLYLMQDDPSAARLYFLVSALFSLWLLAMRSGLYAATSMASDIRQGTFSVLLSTPLTVSGATAAKLVACLLPLWLEVLLALPAALLVYSRFGEAPPHLLVAVTAFQLVVSFLFAGFGLWVGAVLEDPERAAGTVRTLVLVALPGTLLATRLMPDILVLGGLALWVLLVWIPRIRPNQAIPSSVLALVLLLLLPFLPLMSNLGQDLRDLDLNQLNPLHAVQSLSLPRHLSADLTRLTLLEGDPDFEELRAWVPKHFDSSPEHLAARVQAHPVLRQRLEQAHNREGLQRMLLLGLTYGLTGFFLIRLAIGRARKCR
jgi:hypothetical protein